MPDVSLILAGAVSLGSFEAGVLDELLYTLDRLNVDRPDEPYRIDGIAGASAGSMTAALVAQAIMRGLDKRRILHKAWVEDIDILPLLRNVPPNALLSKDIIDAIALDTIPAGDPGAPSSLAAETLRLSFTVTNLNGVNYALARSSDPAVDGTFESTFYAERREFVLHRDRPDDDPWDGIRTAAIASGSFPVAFAPEALASDPRQWPGHSLSELPETFWYVDGGMFNNEPVGEAVRLARKSDDPQVGIDPSRIFLLVDANLNRPSYDPELDGDVGLLPTAGRLATAMMGEATANDWLKALRRNNEVEWRDRMVATLAGLIRDIDLDDPGDLQEKLAAAADDVVAKKRALFGEGRYPADYRTEAVNRINRQFEGHARGLSAAEKTVFGTLVFLLNSVAGLDKKRKLNLHMIHADETVVAGDQLHSFGGFLSQEWRHHDYTVGRARTREALPWILGLDPGELPEPERGVAYEPERPLGSVTMADAPRAARVKVRDAAMEKVKAATRELAVGPGWLRWLSGPLTRFFARRGAKGWLNDLLGL